MTNYKNLNFLNPANQPFKIKCPPLNWIIDNRLSQVLSTRKLHLILSLPLEWSIIGSNTVKMEHNITYLTFLK